MTTVDHMPVMSSSEPRVRRVVLRWGATMPAASVAGLLGGAAAHGVGNGHGELRAAGKLSLRRVEFVLSVEVLDARAALVEAHLDCGGARRPVIEPRRIECELTLDGDLMHLDAALLSLSIRWQEGVAAELLYARTTLLHDAGLRRGGYDAPVMR